MGTILCAASSKTYAFTKQIIMDALQCKDDVDAHLLFCYYVDLPIACPQGRA